MCAGGTAGQASGTRGKAGPAGGEETPFLKQVFPNICTLFAQGVAPIVEDLAERLGVAPAEFIEIFGQGTGRLTGQILVTRCTVQ